MLWTCHFIFCMLTAKGDEPMDINTFINNPEEGAKYCGLLLKENRLERKMTQEQVAFEIGVAPNTISRIELGKVSVSADNLVRLTQLYEIPINIICGEKGFPQEEKILQLEDSLITYFTEDKQWMGIGKVENFNLRTYSFSILNIVFEPTEKDRAGNPHPIPENIDELKNKDTLFSRRNIYIKRMTGLIGKEIFLYSHNFSMALLGRIIRVDDDVVIVKVLYSKDVDSADNE